jgi:osmoprotectant transport system substrate-binding protein
MTRAPRLALLLLALVAALAFAACGGDSGSTGGGGGGGGGGQSEEPAADAIEENPDNAKTAITVGSKNFTEQKILGEIYAQGLTAAGYTVEKELNLGDENIALRSVKEGQVDAYPEYTGTALGSFFDVAAAKIPKDEQKAYEQAKKGFAEDKLTALPPTPFTSSNEVGLTAAKAKELGVKTISDLQGKDQDLTLYGSPECRQRQDCLLGLQEVYGLDFAKFTPVALDLRHEVLKKGQADLSIVFTTDPQIKRENFVLLEDDKGMFPPYNSTLVVRDDVLEKAGPDFAATIEKVQKGLTDEVMQELNARVDLDKKQPAQVAEEYLTESKLIGSGS